MSEATQKQIIDLIKRSNKILIMPSIPPDGDSIGGAIALYLVLKKLGKETTIISQDDIPELLQFLPHTNMVGNNLSSSTDFIISINCQDVKIENIKSTTEGEDINIVITPKEGHLSEDNVTFNKGKVDYDLIITVDTAELSQLGSVYENNIELFHQVPVINIDHHISNTHFGKINYTDIMASSTTELLLQLFEDIAKEEKIEIIDEDIATLLLTGIITDTGSFQNANTTPKSFASSAKLISYGARQQEIIQHIYKTKQLSQLKLWGRVLSKIQTDEKYKIVWSVVSQQDFKDTQSTAEETGDIIDELMTNAPGAEIVFLIKEKEDGTSSISLRTTNPAINASRIAEQFGGGGHTRAAGFRITDKNLRDAEYQIINYMRGLQTKRLGITEEEPETEEEEPMINVEELMQRAKEAEKVTELMPKKKKRSKKKKLSLASEPKEEADKEEDPDKEITYKFED
ncbi:MAG: bifunctional oligoribonuclease/PAP phosphatase NrnA [Nitrospirota bacterium]